MALIFENLNKCPLCNKVLDKTKLFIAIPPLISNVKDELFFLSDEGVHVDCLNNSLLKGKLEYHLDCYEKRIKSTNLHEDIISFGLLTSNENEELYKFNYISVNRNSIETWKQKDSFIHLAQKFINDGKWQSLNDFNYLQYLIDKVRSGEIF